MHYRKVLKFKIHFQFQNLLYSSYIFPLSLSFSKDLGGSSHDIKNLCAANMQNRASMEIGEFLERQSDIINFIFLPN